MAPTVRPTSPHLQIWRFSLAMTMSIVHRITGVALYVGTLLFVAWLAAAAMGGQAHAAVNGFFGHWFIQVVLFGYTWALFHHMAGGIRHLIWDTGHGLDPVGRRFLVRATLVASVGLTLLAWLIFVWL